MTGPPLVVDLFSGEGGAAQGYADAGFAVLCVDHAPMPRCPFPFVRAEALAALDTWRWRGVAAVHASPPCQDYSRHLRHRAKVMRPRLIGQVRDRCTALGIPWVIENVIGSPLPSQDTLDGAHGVELCGTMFGLRIWRHRLFETSFPVPPPGGCHHRVRPLNPLFGPSWRAMRVAGIDHPERAWRAEMGVPWMTQDGARQSIPPAYTRHIGAALMRELTARRAS